MKIFFSGRILGLIGWLMVLSGCNYNFYQGGLMEEQKRYEEAYEYYHKAVLDSPTSQKYLDKERSMALLSAEEMADSYFLALERNDFYNAYSLLKRALSLDPRNLRLITEVDQWYKVLLVGKANFMNLDAMTIRSSGETWLTIDFASAKVDQTLRSRIDPQTGLFYLEDVIYKPVFSYLGFYAIQSIGLRVKNFVGNASLTEGAVDSQDQRARRGPRLSTTGFNSESYTAFVELRNSNVEQARGEFNWQGLIAKGSVLDFAGRRLVSGRRDFSEGYEQPDSGIKYRTELSRASIVVISSADILPFLPMTLYLNKTDKLILLDFGNLDLEYFPKTASWGMRREFEANKDFSRFTLLFGNLNFLLYGQYVGGAFPYTQGP